jgi:hypothetical protein
VQDEDAAIVLATEQPSIAVLACDKSHAGDRTCRSQRNNQPRAGFVPRNPIPTTRQPSGFVFRGGRRPTAFRAKTHHGRSCSQWDSFGATEAAPSRFPYGLTKGTSRT